MLRRIQRPVLFSGLFIFAVIGLCAQTPRVLSFGTWVSDYLQAGDEHWYSVHPQAAGIVYVQTSGDTDTYLEVYDAFRSYIDEDDDSGEGYNASIAIVVEAGKTYFFRVDGFDNDVSGPYSIQAEFEPIPALPFGTWVSGFLSEGGVYLYYVVPSANGFVTVETSGGIDTYLEAFDAFDNFIDSDDDSGEGNNARLEIAVEAGRTYFFRLDGFNADVSGPYNIRAGFRPR